MRTGWWKFKCWSCKSEGGLSHEPALELILLVLVEVADASKVLSRKVALLVVEGLLEVVEVDWLE